MRHWIRFFLREAVFTVAVLLQSNIILVLKMRNLRFRKFTYLA